MQEPPSLGRVLTISFLFVVITSTISQTQDSFFHQSLRIRTQISVGSDWFACYCVSTTPNGMGSSWFWTRRIDISRQFLEDLVGPSPVGQERGKPFGTRTPVSPSSSSRIWDTHVKWMCWSAWLREDILCRFYKIKHLHLRFRFLVEFHWTPLIGVWHPYRPYIRVDAFPDTFLISSAGKNSDAIQWRAEVTPYNFFGLKMLWIAHDALFNHCRELGVWGNTLTTLLSSPMTRNLTD